jgi:hypothetical protein
MNTTYTSAEHVRMDLPKNQVTDVSTKDAKVSCVVAVISLG